MVLLVSGGDAIAVAIPFSGFLVFFSLTEFQWGNEMDEKERERERAPNRD